MTTPIRFQGVEHVGLPQATDQVEANLASFFQWGALGIGAFSNVTIPAGVARAGQHRLRLSEDVNLTRGQQWEGFRKSWVWESNIDYEYQPIAISGVYVNGNFVPKNATGTYAHYVDYENGAVVFRSPIPAASVVTCEYSYRTTQIATADAPWWRLLQQDSYRVDSPQFHQEGSGDWSIMAKNRLQLPAIVVEATSNFTLRPKGIGSTAAINNQEVLFHIVSETRSDMKTWADIVRSQWHHRIPMFDRVKVAESGAYPIQADGSLVANPIMYPDLVDQDNPYYWRQLWFSHIRGSGPYNSHPPLWYTTVAATVEFDA